MTILLFPVYLLTFLAGCQANTAVTPARLPTAVPLATLAQPTATPTAVPPTFTPLPTLTTAVDTATTVTETAVAASATPPPSPTPTPLPPQLNGLTIDEILIMDGSVRENVRQIYGNGQVWGRDLSRISVLGDSTVLNPHLLARFGRDDLILGEYSFLQPTVTGIVTWDRYGVAARNGLHSWSVFDPVWANKDWCEPNEDLLSCEFRLNNPAVLIIRLGSNDAGSPSGFEFNVRQVIEHTIAHGIVPLIMIKPDRFEGDNTNNEILRRLAAELKVPLWDLDRVAETLPGKGLADDQIHMREYVGNDFSDPAIFESGHGMQDLSGLMALHTLFQTMQSGAE